MAFYWELYLQTLAPKGLSLLVDYPDGARNGFAPSAALPTIVDNRLT